MELARYEMGTLISCGFEYEYYPNTAEIGNDIVALLQAARNASARSVNALMTATYWEIGRRIVESEQRGKQRAEYGETLIKQLAEDLEPRFGRGFGWRNLTQMRAFFLTWPASKILQTPSAKSVPLPKLQARHFGTNTWRADKPQNPEQSRIKYELILSEIPFLAADSPAITKAGTSDLWHF